MRITRLTAPTALLVSTLAFSGAGRASEIETLVLTGDVIDGIGNVTRIDNLAINDHGDWIVEFDTDHSDTNRDVVYFRNGAVYLREGDALDQPPGASISSIDSININNSLQSGWNFFLRGTTGGNDDSGVYLGDQLVLQEGTISTSPDFSAGTPYIGFFDVKINNADQLALVASIDDPAIPTSVDRALVRLDLVGTAYTEHVLFKEGDVLPGQSEAVTDFGTGPHSSAFNDLGDIMFVADLTGASTTDGVVYLNDALLAQEGAASPVAGRNWLTLSTSVRLDVNNNGGYVHTGTLDGDTGSDTIIVTNNGKLIQEGDTLPAIGGAFTFTSFGTGPVWIADNGKVLWYGDWNDTNTDVDTGYFVDHDLIVQEGVSTAGGIVIDTLVSGESGYAMSDNGRWIIFEATLANGRSGAFRIRLSTPGDANCDGAVNNFDIDAFTDLISGG